MIIFASAKFYIIMCFTCILQTSDQMEAKENLSVPLLLQLIYIFNLKGLKVGYASPPPLQGRGGKLFGRAFKSIVQYRPKCQKWDPYLKQYIHCRNIDFCCIWLKRMAWALPPEVEKIFGLLFKSIVQNRQISRKSGLYLKTAYSQYYFTVWSYEGGHSPSPCGGSWKNLWFSIQKHCQNKAYIQEMRFLPHT